MLLLYCNRKEGKKMEIALLLIVSLLVLFSMIVLKHNAELNDRLTKEIHHSLVLEKTIEEIIKK